jgi:hypothetical protein
MLFLLNHTNSVFFCVRFISYFSFMLVIREIFTKAETGKSYIKYGMLGFIFVFAMGVAMDLPYSKVKPKILTIRNELKQSLPNQDLLKSALVSPIDAVRSEIAKNENTPEEYLKDLMNDKNKEIKQYALANLERRGYIPIDINQFKHTSLYNFFRQNYLMIGLFLIVMIVLIASRIPYFRENKMVYITMLTLFIMGSSAITATFINDEDLRDYTLEYALEKQTVTDKDIGQWVLSLDSSGIEYLVSQRRFIPDEPLNFILMKQDVAPEIKILVKKELHYRGKYPSLDDEELQGFGTLPSSGHPDFNFNSL